MLHVPGNSNTAVLQISHVPGDRLAVSDVCASVPLPLYADKKRGVSSYLRISAGLSPFPHQRFGHPGLRLFGQPTEDLSGRGAGRVWASRGSAVRGLFLLQPLHDMRRLPGGGAGPAGEA